MAKVLSLLLLYLAFATVPLAAQSKAKKILLRAAEACEQVKQGSYEVSYRHKFFSSNDTLSKTGEVHFQKITKDNVGAKLRLLVEDEPERLYTGEALYLVNHQQETIFQVDSAAGAFNFIRGNPSGNLVLNPLAADSDIFQQLTRSSGIRIGKGKAVKVNGTTCFTIKISFPDNEVEQTQHSYRIYYIGKKDYLPRKYEDFLDWQGQHQYMMVELKNLQVNKPQEANLYSINAFPDDYKVEKHKPKQAP
ncbi:hypothetical protein [Pontibacter harenae]|uniref:hypothetical protein n=1 Tax=Pontibacter harenae TaxID=2894083 RepID=UPI001E2A7A05|nr:hypothetical protein [Pontibacter harenae]MCC9167157.1 hypothetical protein [Pontibacter harenae]